LEEEKRRKEIDDFENMKNELYTAQYE